MVQAFFFTRFSPSDIYAAVNEIKIYFRKIMIKLQMIYALGSMIREFLR